MLFFDYLPQFLLVFVRLTSFFVSAPLWMDRQVPGPYKWGFAFFTSILVVGVIDHHQVLEFDGEFILLVLKETMVGLCLGFIAAILLYAVQVAGSFIDLQSGFAMASMFNAQTGVQEPITGRLFYIITMVFFLSVNGHHILIQGVLASFDWLPVDSWLPVLVSKNLAALSLEVMRNMLWLAFLIAAPIAGALFLVDVALGILSKTAPQMNLFVVGIPVKMFVHYLVLYAFLPGFFFVLGKLVRTMVHSLEQLLKILGS
ncbi:flagellar biosynthetic protein FliR [Neobacillus sp. 114]|uniref:flagellar biosynthetic protein FliR n=1 Tax=Neobacillus sp. 114 TaxID=3048535 RepID=UPI0024C34EAA|nr:flagellar biosynthetic protein FliR [Neobacillus sp. 114]